MSDPIRSVVDEHMRQHPLTEVERDQLARAATGDSAGLWRKDESGRWEQL